MAKGYEVRLKIQGVSGYHTERIEGVSSSVKAKKIALSKYGDKAKVVGVKPIK